MRRRGGMSGAPGLVRSHLTDGAVITEKAVASRFVPMPRWYFPLQPPRANRFHMGGMVAVGLVGIGSRKFRESRIE